MIQNDIDALKQKLYKAMDQGDENIIYDISVKLDVLIVEFYNFFKN